MIVGEPQGGYMNTKKIIILTALVFVASLLIVSCKSGSDTQENVEINDFNLEYGLYRFPSPIEPMSYMVRINSEGVLYKEYANAEMYEGDFGIITKQLSPDDMKALLDVILTNKFFSLPENVDGKNNITDQDARFLTITYNGETHVCNGYNTKNRKYSLICAYIEKLAQ